MEKVFYRCDPEKNTECRKYGCFIHRGECKATSKAECSVKDEDGAPIVEFIVKRGEDNGTAGGDLRTPEG